jgi:hypothetical protein
MNTMNSSGPMGPSPTSNAKPMNTMSPGPMGPSPPPATPQANTL